MNATKFSFDIASVVFGDHVPEVRGIQESAAVARFKPWISRASKETVHAKCASIDKNLVAHLSGLNMLEVARMIESRFPDVIENMALLDKHLNHLNRAHQIAQVFMPSSLSMLVNALEEEGSR